MGDSREASTECQNILKIETNNDAIELLKSLSWQLQLVNEWHNIQFLIVYCSFILFSKIHLQIMNSTVVQSFPLHWYVLTCQNMEKILFHFETSTHWFTAKQSQRFPPNKNFLWFYFTQIGKTHRNCLNILIL